MKKPRIAIIGAGLAGISAARTLYQGGLEDIIIFEASDKIGGRIRSVKHEAGWIELGAQWIHGQEENILFEYASSKGLIADTKYDYGIEGNGCYCTEEGQLCSSPLIKKLINHLDERKNRMEDAIEKKQNVFDYFKQHFETFIQSFKTEIDDETLKFLYETFRWFILFEVIDNSCENLQTLSALSYTEWEDCPGIVDLINFKENYSTLFDELIQDFPLDKFLIKNTAVKRIEFKTSLKKSNNDQNNDENILIKLQISKNKNNNVAVDDDDDDNEFFFDHVIITSSIGFLKENLYTNFFGFKLPIEKIQVIRALGFGTINKIFLCFDEPFWNDDVKGFQMLWSHVTDEHSYSNDSNNQINNDNINNNNRIYNSGEFPEWVYCIQGFDLVRNQPNMLMAWIGSYGAKQMEYFSDNEIAQILTNVLKQIVPESCRCRSIDVPIKIYCSRWNSDPFIRGSYSNRTIMYEKLSKTYTFGNSNSNDDDDDDDYFYPIDLLAQPITLNNIIETNIDSDSSNKDKPLILFAGEATDRKHYSTTHGAMNSGQREANRLLSFYQMCLN